MKDRIVVFFNPKKISFYIFVILFLPLIFIYFLIYYCLIDIDAINLLIKYNFNILLNLIVYWNFIC